MVTMILALISFSLVIIAVVTKHNITELLLLAIWLLLFAPIAQAWLHG